MNEYMDKAKKWIHNNIVDNNGGIVVTHKQRITYPEVTGYFIPSLLKVGEKELAISFARHLCEIQKPNGAWHDPSDRFPFVFDGGQILKGLIAIREYLPEVDENIIKGIDWIFSNMKDTGELNQPKNDLWGDKDDYCNELIHIYCMSPIIDAGKLFNRPDYIEKANKVLDHYIKNYRERIVNFSLFSHFYAYVIEGLIDCGRVEIAREAMSNYEKYRRKDGSVYAWNNAGWTCSTATFQFAIIWYKLDERGKADKSYEYACSLQNETGGWYGSYVHSPLDYIDIAFKRRLYEKKQEISWAVKFFIDATYYKEQSKIK